MLMTEHTSEPLIQWGLDPSRAYINIIQAEEKQYYYRCPECGEYLQVRHGEVRIWYYAHVKLESDSPNCPLRTQAGVTQWNKKFMKSPIEIDEAKRKYQLVLIKNHYTNQLELYANLPTLSWNSFNNSHEVENTLKDIKILGSCIKRIVNGQIFHPSEAEALIEMFPNDSKMEITIESPKSINITGTWCINPLKNQDIFIGNKYRAIRSDNDFNIYNGNYIYIILKDIPQELPKNIQIYHLESFIVLSFEINDENVEYIKKYALKQISENNLFNVDIILPSYSDPNPTAPIQGLSDEEILIAITPPNNADPTFEIVSIPFSANNEFEISKTGPGNPRFYSLKFLKEGSHRLSIHWGMKHKYLNFHTCNNLDINVPYKNNRFIGVKLRNGHILTPYSENNYELIKLKKNDNKNKLFEIISFGEMKVDLIGRFLNDKNEIMVYREYNINSIKAQEIISDWIYSEVTIIKIIFGSLGIVTIEYQTIDPLSDFEIENKLRQINILPINISTSFIKHILDLDPDTPYHDIPGGSKKRIRKIIKKIRYEKG